MSDHNYDPAGVTIDALCAALESGFPGMPFKVNSLSRPASLLTISFSGDLDAVQVAALDALVEGHKASDTALVAARLVKSAEIDSRTDELIAEGFVFAGITFSLSLEQQLRIEGSDRLRDDPLFIYPVLWNSKDDSQQLSIENAATMHGVYLTAVGTLRARIDSGTAFKDQVRAAATVTQVNAVVDTR